MDGLSQISTWVNDQEKLNIREAVLTLAKKGKPTKQKDFLAWAIKEGCRRVLEDNLVV